MVGQSVRVNYTSKAVPIADDFLAGPPPEPIQIHRIDFRSSPLPENGERIALTIDNVLAPSECAQLIQLAESSVLGTEDGGMTWKPAMVSVGDGLEAPAPDYRNCGRIVWDQQTVVDRIWERCAHAPGLRDLLAEVVPEGSSDGQKWEFRRFNERMRFLRYGAGQFFKPHSDGPTYFEDNGKEFQTHYTVQLYLNDSATVSATGEGVVGGATSFLSRDLKRRIDVNPKAGTVLIFQHFGLRHEGAKVEHGVKYTVRMDVIYEWLDGSGA